MTISKLVKYRDDAAESAYETAEFSRLAAELPNWESLRRPMRDFIVMMFTLGYNAASLNTLAAECHAANQHWWHDPRTGARLDRNKGELLMLIVSEVAEAMEGERKNLMDDKLPHRRMAEVELADVLIRVFDYAGAYGFDLDGAVAEKRAFNATRADHKAEARLAPGGKAF